MLSNFAVCPNCKSEYPIFHSPVGALHTLCDNCGWTNNDMNKQEALENFANAIGIPYKILANKKDNKMIEYITGGRASGKTYKAVQWLNQDPNKRIIIVPNSEMADIIINQYALLPKQVMSFASWKDIHNGRGMKKEVCIDNAEIILQMLLGGNKLSMITWSRNE